MPYLNTGPAASKAVFPEKEYHLDTPADKYDLVSTLIHHHAFVSDTVGARTLFWR